MNKRYGFANRDLKFITYFLIMTLLFGLVLSFNNVAEANETPVQEDTSEDATPPVETEGDDLDATPDNLDESDGAVEPEDEISEEADEIDALVEQPEEESGESYIPAEKPEKEPAETQELEEPVEQDIEGDEETPQVVEKNYENPDGLAEYFPSVLEDPITLPSYYFQKSLPNLRSGGLQDTIVVDKTAERTKDKDGECKGCRTFEVLLKITGTPQEAPVDVVLVLDRSGSMGFLATEEYVAITSGPNTSKNYYVKVDGEYIEVSHSWNNGWRYWSPNNYRYVSWNPNGNDNSAGTTNSNSPLGKPFYEKVERTRLYYAKQAAINFAAKVLGPDGIPGSRVSIVSYSGPSTTSGNGNQNQASTDRGLTSDLNQVVYAINGLNALGGTNTQAGFIQGRNVIQNSGNPNSNKVVIMFTDGLPTASNGNRYAETTSLDHVHVTTAITAGKSIFDGNIADVFTIGLLQGMSGAELTLARSILNQTQNKGFYEAPDAQDLDDIFQDISQKLGYSATNAVVVDKIGNNFNLVESSLPSGATYNPNTREITWNPGTIVDEAELRYIVQAKPDFVGGLANTNEYANLTYTDIFGITGQNQVFPVPEVDVPEKLAVSLTDATIVIGDSITLASGTDPNGDNYMSPITGGDGDDSYAYEWRIEGETDVFSTEKNPTVTPQDDTSYQLTVIDSNGCEVVAVMKVTVLKTVDVTIAKEVTGNFGDRTREFSFTVAINHGDPDSFSLAHGEEHTLKDLLLDAVITLTEDDSGYDVTVTASGITSPITPNEGIYTIEVSELTGDMTITVTNHKSTTIDTGISLDSLPYIIILALVIAGITVIFIRKRRISSED